MYFGKEDTEGFQNPGLSVFTRSPDGTIYHRYTIGAEFDEHNNRGIDPYTPVWNLFDLLPQGRGDSYPTHGYMERHHHSQEPGLHQGGQERPVLGPLGWCDP